MNAIDIVLEEVAAMRGVSLNDLRASGGAKALTKPRQEAMYLARKLTLEANVEIGRRINRHDSTVCHAIHSIERRIDNVVGYGDELEAMGAAIMPRLRCAEVPVRTPLVDRVAALEACVQALAAQLAELAQIHSLTMREPVSAVLTAYRQFESDRYSGRERFAQQQLDRALKALQTTVEQKDIAA
ncbi:helix-turn-helix domain-containing protein [Aurantimonas sp. 22II-16-19i]|uniref:helix-turn-helix domain-containing protein n=1 Tax=Aurantimonas sp. 22II-16-19i TaxID=1317114 RepID=UPI0009F7EAFC|nr:helix-turn-helix domain-containing protein [Aurantimonas sp. 22II-16-19i]ORE93230.1 chromosomal replication initiation protein [Aurantimonas sp. 22II-16-19i]